jgi:signal transduction histidine kinase/CheY-like chemotaxis protein/HAMP domain-containing protein
MNIRTKLYLGFGTLLILMFALAGIGLSRLTSSDNTITEIYDNRYYKVQYVSNMRYDVSDLARGISNLLLMNNEESERSNLQTILTLRDKLTGELNRANGIFADPDARVIGSKLLYDGQQYVKFVDEVVRLYREGNKQQAGELRSGVGVPLQEKLNESIKEMSAYQDKSLITAIDSAKQTNRDTMYSTGLVTVIGLLFGFAVMYWIIASMTRGLGVLGGMITGFANGRWGDASYRVPIVSRDEFGQLAKVFNQLAEDLEETTAKERMLNKLTEERAWIQTQIASMYSRLQEAERLEELGEAFIGELCRVVEAQAGAVYALDRSERGEPLLLIGSYALTEREPALRLRLGQGLIGQCAADGRPIALNNWPRDYAAIGSAYGEVAPAALYVMPVVYDEAVIGAFEMASMKPFTELQEQLVTQIAEVFGTVLNGLQGRLRIEKLLRIHQALTDELQSQSEELLSQQDELKASNERLEEQTKALRSSEQLLQRQQEELEHINRMLELKAAELEEQIRSTEEANEQLEQTKRALEKQAAELKLASKYKSEFLANMSHELRTPLNSLLILSQLLRENKDSNLTGKQVEYAETIYSSGCDLLKLIDDVLDLAKVESGRMELHHERVRISELVETVEKVFEPVARKKELIFEVQVADGVPAELESDGIRVHQILKNLLSNALKFTHKGKVRLTVDAVREPKPMISFAVEDTGIGISPEKQQMIFEAFQQADGTTSRKYGGTGLGLSISRELAQLLGGFIELSSTEGTGSRFTLHLPLRAGWEHSRVPALHAGAEASAAAEPLKPAAPDPWKRAAAEEEPPGDDRDAITEEDRVLLIIEDDAHFAQILLDMTRSRGFKGVVAHQGDTGLELARKLQPDAILLDIQLPVIDGWSVLVQLKHDAATRHIPVHVISVVDEIHQGLSMGAIAWLRKPSSKESLEQAFAHVQSFLQRELRELLIVQEDERQRSSLIELISHDDVRITAVAGGKEALQALEERSYDCMVLDYGITEPGIYELLDRIKAEEKLRRLPILIYTGTTLDKKEQLRLKKYAESIIVKDVKSPERLLDETALFLHRVEERLPEEKKIVLQKLHSKKAVFAGKKVLLADDDIRNVFALSNLLEGMDMQVSFAETGRGALELLEREPDFDMVLMDIMMPEMDGYEAMRAIRSQEAFEHLPIIALTAKAMKDDREKCLMAGASDYITKPIHAEQLLSLMRVWLCK